MATKATLRNQRKGTSARHNDRDFDYENAEHIDETRTKQNIYFKLDKKDNKYMSVKSDISFEQHELAIYERLYSASLSTKNEQYKKKGHKEKIKSIENLLHSEKLRPCEQILQVGKHKNGTQPSRKELYSIFMQYLKSLEKYPNLQVLDVAFHFDEESDHIHLRFTIFGHDKNNDLEPNQAKGCREMNIERPDEKDKNSRYNNPMMTLTKEMREIWYETIKEHGIELDEEPAPRRKHKTKEEYDYELALAHKQVLEAQQKYLQLVDAKLDTVEDTINDKDFQNYYFKQLAKSISTLTGKKMTEETIRTTFNECFKRYKAEMAQKAKKDIELPEEIKDLDIVR